MSNSVTFESAFDDFMSKVRHYNSAQRKEILHLTVKAYQGILAAFPSARVEDDENNNNGASAPSDARSRRLLEEVESFIFDRMYQLGFDKSLFHKLDTKLTGFVTPAEFRAAVAQVGVALTDQELQAITQKFDPKADGTINYDDFWKYVNARRETYRSTAQEAYNSANLGRKFQDGSETANLLGSLPKTLEQRLAIGRKSLMETMYLKSSNFHAQFQQLQNADKLVAVGQVVPQLTKMGFPPGLCTEEEINEVVKSYSQKNPGFLSYAEYLGFFMGHEPVDVERDDELIHENPSLLNALVKVNNINLRKFFKDLDRDSDGLITTDELIQGLVDHGMNASLGNNKKFIEYLESFSQKKVGFFAYAEFIKFVNTRLGQTTHISGQPLSTLAPVEIGEELSAGEIMDLVIKTIRVTAVSVPSAFAQFDSNDDGKLDEAEFFQGFVSLGFNVSPNQSRTLFDALDTDGNGYVDIQEFARLVVNPFKNTKLSTKVRHAPGGESSVPLGSYSIEAPDYQRKTSVRVIPAAQNYSISQQGAPLSDEEVAATTTAVRNPPKYGTATIDLSFDPNEAAPRSLRPESKGDLTGRTLDESYKDTPRRTSTSSSSSSSSSTNGRIPPGGRSTIDFGNDHGAEIRMSSKKVQNKELITFDPNAPVASVGKPRPHTAGGPSSVKLTDEPLSPPPVRTLTAPLQSPGGNSTVSFNQNDSAIHRPSHRVLASPGGNSNLDLAFPDLPSSPTPAPVVRRPQDEINVDLSFDPHAEVEEHRRVKKTAEGIKVSVQLAHSPIRQDEDLDGHHAMSHHRTRKHVAGVQDQLALGSDASALLLAQYKDEPEEIDVELLKKLSHAIYNHSQRLRHTFQEFNRSSSSSTLSKDNLKAGAASLAVELTDAQVDALFRKFDTDADGQISYSEFVRMLAIQ